MTQEVVQHCSFSAHLHMLKASSLIAHVLLIVSSHSVVPPAYKVAFSRSRWAHNAAQVLELRPISSALRHAW